MSEPERLWVGTSSDTETEDLGRLLGRLLAGGAEGVVGAGQAVDADATVEPRVRAGTGLGTQGVTIALKGPLGAGKTCLVRGIAAGLGFAAEQIASPTFVYMVEYEAVSDGTSEGELEGADARRRLVHADLYRLGDIPEEAAEEVFESIGLIEAMGSNAVTAVEWWEYYRGALPERLIFIEFQLENVDTRSITLEFSGLSAAPLRAQLALERL